MHTDQPPGKAFAEGIAEGVRRTLAEIEYAHAPFTRPECPPEECIRRRSGLPPAIPLSDCDCFDIAPMVEVAR